MSPPVSQKWYRRQMFIENRIEERNEQIVVLERSDEKNQKVFPKVGTHYKIAVRRESVGWWKYSVEK